MGTLVQKSGLWVDQKDPSHGWAGAGLPPCSASTTPCKGIRSALLEGILVSASNTLPPKLWEILSLTLRQFLLEVLGCPRVLIVEKLFLQAV